MLRALAAGIKSLPPPRPPPGLRSQASTNNSGRQKIKNSIEVCKKRLLLLQAGSEKPVRRVYSHSPTSSSGLHLLYSRLAGEERGRGGGEEEAGGEEKKNRLWLSRGKTSARHFLCPSIGIIEGMSTQQQQHTWFDEKIRSGFVTPCSVYENRIVFWCKTFFL